MSNNTAKVPDSTAVRVALWRALHSLQDEAPHLIEDTLGLQLVNPEPGWENRPDMHLQGTAPFRASIVARARFIEDWITRQYLEGLRQMVILGSGLDTFAQRRSEKLDQLKIFEIDRPETLAWKQKRLLELGFQMEKMPTFISCNFEHNSDWRDQLLQSNFIQEQPALVTSMGVTMYLTMDAIKKMLTEMKSLPKGSFFITTFMWPIELVDPQDKPGYELSLRGAERSGTPFISFFSAKQISELLKGLGFTKFEIHSTNKIYEPFFNQRKDGLKPSSGEEILVLQI